METSVSRRITRGLVLRGTLLVKGVDVAQALSDDPKWVDYWESSVRTCKYSPDLLRTVATVLHS